MRSDFAPDIMIGVNVGSSDKGPQTSIIAQLENLICAPDPADVPADELVGMRIDLDRFGLLDFGKAQEIYRVGYDAAMAHMDSIRSRVTSRTLPAARAMRREQFRARVPSTASTSAAALHNRTAIWLIFSAVTAATHSA